MKKIFSIICFIRSIYYTYIYSSFFSLSMGYISGHNYYEQKDGSLKCKTCGNISK